MIGMALIVSNNVNGFMINDNFKDGIVIKTFLILHIVIGII